MKTWSLKRTVQCAKCPWRKDADPLTIPNGYSVEKHKALKGTIAEHGDLSAILNGSGIRAMACHEDHDSHCAGWLSNQAGPGNNIALRIKLMSCENVRQVKLCGEQHETFEETLPVEGTAAYAHVVCRRIDHFIKTKGAE